MSHPLLDAHGHARWLNQSLAESHLLDFLSPAAAASLTRAVAHGVVEFQRTSRGVKTPDMLRVPVMAALAEHPLGGALSGTWRHQVAETVACGYAALVAMHLEPTG